MSARRPAPEYGRHFGDLAARYDELRSGPSDDAIEVLVREGDLRGRRVLDVGCGTGRMAATLAKRYGATVSGIDPSVEMLEIARDRASQGIVALERGTAENTSLSLTATSSGRSCTSLIGRGPLASCTGC
jgi:ubiquinone/menaquinone biosynthesis C-methylase UbiE